MTDTPQPMWTAENVRNAAAALLQEMQPLLKTKGEHQLAKDLTNLMATQLQLTEALEVQHRMLQKTGQLAADCAAAHRLQVRALSQRLEVLEGKA